MKFLLGAILLIIIVLFIYIRKKKRQQDAITSKQIKAQTQEIQSSHLGVALIAPNPDACCQHAREQLGKLISDKDIPSLPFPGCDRKTLCKCTFNKRYENRLGEERRSEEDRRGEGIRFEDKPERRSHIDRRKHSSMWKSDRS